MGHGFARWYSAFLPVLLIVGLAGCASPAAPLPSTNGPTPSPQSPSLLSGKVLEPSGTCIRGAIVESIAGQAVGQKAVQTGSCDYWSYGGGGFTFTDLTPGVLMTLRASAPGFITREISNVGPSQSEIIIDLEPVSAH
jgi:hypothetical protein